MAKGNIIFDDLIATDFHKLTISVLVERSWTIFENTGSKTVAEALITILANGNSIKPLENSAKVSFPQ